MVAYISLKSYLSGGSRTILLLGSGTLAWGFASMVAGWLLSPPGGPNVAVTVSNSGALFASLLFIASATTTMREGSSRDSKRRTPKLLLAYGGAVGFPAVLTAFALLGATPAFFVPGVGSTVLRQAVVAAGLFLFAASSILFMRLYRDSRSGILFWYSMALALTTIGLAAFYFGRTVGDPIALDWENSHLSRRNILPHRNLVCCPRLTRQPRWSTISRGSPFCIFLNFCL